MMIAEQPVKIHLGLIAFSGVGWIATAFLKGSDGLPGGIAPEQSGVVNLETVGAVRALTPEPADKNLPEPVRGAVAINVLPLRPGAINRKNFRSSAWWASSPLAA